MTRQDYRPEPRPTAQGPQDDTHSPPVIPSRRVSPRLPGQVVRRRSTRDPSQWPSSRAPLRDLVGATSRPSHLLTRRPTDGDPTLWFRTQVSPTAPLHRNPPGVSPRPRNRVAPKSSRGATPAPKPCRSSTLCARDRRGTTRCAAAHEHTRRAYPNWSVGGSGRSPREAEAVAEEFREVGGPLGRSQTRR